MFISIVKIIIGAVLLIDQIACVFISKEASDYIYFLTHPFGIASPVRIGATIRMLCTALSGALLYSGIAGLL